MNNPIGQTTERGSKMGIKIKTYVKATAANAYAADVAELIAAGEGQSGAITVKNDAPKLNDDGTPKYDSEGNAVSDNSIDAAKRGFQSAARDAGKTARLLSVTDNGDGTSDLDFLLSDLIVRKSKDSTGASADEENAPDAEYPAESPVEPEAEESGKRSRR